MFCGQCGKRVNDEDRFCRHCGRPIPSQDPVAGAPTRPQGRSESEPVERRGEPPILEPNSSEIEEIEAPVVEPNSSEIEEIEAPVVEPNSSEIEEIEAPVVEPNSSEIEEIEAHDADAALELDSSEIEVLDAPRPPRPRSRRGSRVGSSRSASSSPSESHDKGSTSNRAEQERRNKMLWFIGNPDGKLETRRDIVVKLLNLSYPALDALCQQATELRRKELRQAPLLVELLARARRCDVGPGAVRYDAHHGYRQALLASAEQLARAPADATRSLARRLCRGMISEDNATELLAPLEAALEDGLEAYQSERSHGLLRGLCELTARLTEQGKTLAIEAQLERHARRARRALTHRGEEPTELTKSLLEVAESLLEKRRPAPLEGAGRMLEPEPEPEPQPASDSRSTTSSKPSPLGPGEVARLANDPCRPIELASVFDKIALPGFIKDPFTIALLRLGQRPRGLPARSRLLDYALGGLERPSKSTRAKAKVVALELLAPEQHADLEGALRRQLGEALLATLAMLFDKKKGSLIERTQRAASYTQAIVSHPRRSRSLLAALAESLESGHPLAFREPEIQVIFRGLKKRGATPGAGAKEADLERITRSIERALSRADAGKVRFPSERAEDYFRACGQRALEAIAALRSSDA